MSIQEKLQRLDFLSSLSYLDHTSDDWDEELIIGGDIDIEDGMNGFPEFSVMTNLSCPRCESQVEVLKKRDAFD